MKTKEAILISNTVEFPFTVGEKLSILKAMEEYSLQQNSELSKELSTLRENVDKVRGQSLEKIRKIEAMASEMEERNNELSKEVERLKDKVRDMGHQLTEGRYYLMGTEPTKLTVEDALEAFGFGRNGLKI